MSDSAGEIVGGILGVILVIAIMVSNLVGLWVAFNDGIAQGFLALIFPPIAWFLGFQYMFF